MNNQKTVLRAVLIFLVAIALIVYGFPLLYTLNTALKTQRNFLVDPVGISEGINLENFVQAWEKGNMASGIKNSLLYVSVCTIVSLSMAVFLSYPIARRYVKFATFIYMLFMIGMFLPDGSIPRWRFIFRMGLYDTRLGYMLTLVGGGGVTLLMFVSYIRSLPKDLDEAAMIDGCGYLQFIFKILLPLMKPALASMGVLQAIGIWNEVTNSVIYFSNKNYFPITRGLYVFRSDYSVKWPELTAALVIIAVPMIVLYTFLQKYIIDGIVSGGVKA